MLSADNDITTGQAFTIKTGKRPDGTSEAWTPNAKELGKTVGDTTADAVRFLNDRIHAFVMNGYKVK